MTRLGAPYEWLVGILILLTTGGLPGAGLLPVYIEESHAGAFYHLAERLPPSDAHTLILLDAHSDANAIANSDVIRGSLRQGGGNARRLAEFEKWRKQGRIQCFNWIEPLMPAPIAEVIWVPAMTLSESERVRLEQEARDALDAHEEAMPREVGALASRYRVLDFDGLQKEIKSWSRGQKVVASIDLDFFAQYQDDQVLSALEEVLDVILKQRGLQSLSFAISSPYLRDQVQSEWLLNVTLEAAFRIANAEVHFEPMATTGPDRSLMARLRERKGETLPAFDLRKVGLPLRSLLLRQWQVQGVRYGRSEIDDCLMAWREDAFLPHIQAVNGQRGDNLSWYFEAGIEGGFILAEAPVGARVRWYALCAKESRYHVGDIDFGFASGCPSWIFQERVLLAEGVGLGKLALANLAPVLHPKYQCGTVEIFAEVIYDGKPRVTERQKVHVRMAGTRGARAAWSEQFMLPYVFDSRLLMRNSKSGPEAALGADCANFITHGLRREGWRLPWGNPRELLPWMEVTPTIQGEEPTLLYFGNHLAALWEDRPPLGQLNDEDLCVHQLEGAAEIIELAKLKKNRSAPKLLRLAPVKQPVRLIFAGDVMLGRGVLKNSKGHNPMKALSAWLANADAVIGNLECVIVSRVDHDIKPQPGPPKLVASPEAATWLKEANFKIVSVANNHALDAGEQGQQETLDHLHNAGILSAESCEVTHMEVQGMRFAFIAWDDSSEADDTNLIKIIQAEQEEETILFVMPHWGREHQIDPTPRQQFLTRRWLDAGAHWIVGSGPHCVQSLVQNPRGGVAYSLGNAVFDGKGPDENWQRGAWLELTFDATTKVALRARLIPTVFDAAGRVSFSEDSGVGPHAD